MRVLGHVGVAHLELVDVHVDERLLAGRLALGDVHVKAFVPLLAWPQGLGLPLEVANFIAGHLVHVLQVTTQIATLREGLLALGAREGPLPRMLAEMVAQVAALLEDRAAACVTTAEIQLHAHRFRIPHLDGLVPRVRNALEGLAVHAALSAQLGDLRALSELVHEGLGLVLAAGDGRMAALVINLGRFLRLLDFNSRRLLIDTMIRFDQILRGLTS